MSSERLGYSFVLELFRDEDATELLSAEQVEVDWEPALQSARFTLSRKQSSQRLILEGDDGVIEPLWETERGAPYLQGVRIGLRGTDDSDEYYDVSRTYFCDLARAASAKLVEQGVLADGDTFRYRVCAYPRSTRGGVNYDNDRGLSVTSVVRPLDVRQHSLDGWLARSVPCGQINGEYPVFIPQELIREAVDLTEEAGAAETGGILLGHVHRDLQGPELFAEVTAQIPARYAQQELTRLTFNAETWSDVDAAIRLRNRGELYIGWWHSHPARQWCKDCPVENRMKCKLSGEFFSTHDVALHRTVFPQAYCVALVISDSYANGLTWPLFGWHQGMVQQRGFYVLDGATESVGRPDAS